MTNLHIHYVELPATDLAAMQAFYGAAFGWTFESWGEDYMAFSNAGVEGGFCRVAENPPRGGALVILHAPDLASAERRVVDAGGEIVARHEFPGGRRFQFLDPSGNELGVWTQVEADG